MSDMGVDEAEIRTLQEEAEKDMKDDQPEDGMASTDVSPTAAESAAVHLRQ